MDGVGVDGDDGGKEQQLFPKGSQVEVSIEQEGFEDAWYVATVVDPPLPLPHPQTSNKNKKRRRRRRETQGCSGKYLVEYQTLMSDHDCSKPFRDSVDACRIRPLPPAQDDALRFHPNHIVDAFHRDGWRTGVISRVIDDQSTKFLVCFRNPTEQMEFARSHLRLHSEWVDRSWVLSGILQGPDEPKGRKRNQTKKRQPRFLGNKSTGSAEEEEYNETGGVAYQMVVRDCVAKEAEFPPIWGTDFSVTRGSVNEDPFKIHGKEYLKLIADSKMLLNSAPQRNEILSNIMKLHLSEMNEQPNETIAQIFGKQLEKFVSRRQLQRRTTKNGISLVRDSQDGCGRKTDTDCIIEDVEVIPDELPGNQKGDDQPLLLWFEGMRSPTVNDSGVPVSLVRTPNTGAGTSNEKEENEMQSVAIGSTCKSMSAKNRSLPFVKRSPLWEMIESMEAFQMMPQKPHFCPLDTCKEDCREGLAIGNMVTFASVVDRTSKLQLDDPRDIIDCILETLLELEIHGFEIEPVRGRLKELLSKKERQVQLKEELKEVEREMRVWNLEKGKIDEEIDETEKKIVKLEEKLALAKAAKEMKDTETSTLQSKMDSIKEDVQNARLDFGRLATFPWQ